MLAFVVAAKKFFGLKPGQTITEFLQECKQLTEKDRGEMTPLLEKELGEPVSASMLTPK